MNDPNQVGVPDQATQVTLNPQYECALLNWGNFSKSGIRNRINRGEFIVSPWDDIEGYKQIKLAKGWELATTAVAPKRIGTIYLVATLDKNKEALDTVMRNYFVNFGLTIAQAETFMEAECPAKFKVLFLLNKVLNDGNLYKAYRQHKRNMNLSAYTKWLAAHDLIGHPFNMGLDNVLRNHLSDVLHAMMRADVKLRPKRLAEKVKRENKTSA